MRRLLAILPDDRLRTLEAWLARIPEAVRQRIRVATADLKRGYATILARWCPQVRAVADPFHVIHDANARLDAVRRLEPSEAHHAIPRWPLVKGAERLTARQRTPWAAIQAQYPAWGALYRLKEALRSLFHSPTADAAAQALSAWNELSRRYTVTEPTFYVPAKWHRASPTNKQASAEPLSAAENAAWAEGLRAHVQASLALYREALNVGIAGEQARAFLPANIQYTTWY